MKFYVYAPPHLLPEGVVTEFAVKSHEHFVIPGSYLESAGEDAIIGYWLGKDWRNKSYELRNVRIEDGKVRYDTVVPVRSIEVETLEELMKLVRESSADTVEISSYGTNNYIYFQEVNSDY